MPTTNCVKFENWYDQPIHCPFCGHAQQPNIDAQCKHFLYVILGGNFLDRSARFDKNLQDLFGPSSGWPDFDLSDKKKLGNPYDIANKVRAQMSPSIEYQIIDPCDISYVGFAALDEERCSFGREHRSPYAD